MRGALFKFAKIALPLLIQVTLLLPALPANVDAQLQDERAVKAAFVFNLTKYVEWPKPDGDINVAYVGDDSMADVLPQMLAGKVSNGRPIRVLISPSDADLERCDVLYVGYSSSEKIRQALTKTARRPILTVGDGTNFIASNGMVALSRKGNQIQIEVNLDAVHAAQLKISSRLLNLSTIVHSSAGEVH
jgi:hypothetical protein